MARTSLSLLSCCTFWVLWDGQEWGKEKRGFLGNLSVCRRAQSHLCNAWCLQWHPSSVAPGGPLFPDVPWEGVSTGHIYRGPSPCQWRGRKGELLSSPVLHEDGHFRNLQCLKDRETVLICQLRVFPIDRSVAKERLWDWAHRSWGLDSRTGNAPSNSRQNLYLHQKCMMLTAPTLFKVWRKEALIILGDG